MTPPLTPDEDEGRRWVIEELAKPEYRAAEPTWFDQIVASFWDWVNSLFDDVSGFGFDITPILLVILIGVIALIVFLIFGRPALARRSQAQQQTAVFLDDDSRSTAELRAAAAAAASKQDYTLAIREQFRAISRSLSDRTIIALRPGSTAHDVARRAAAAFPDRTSHLESAANAFDRVRYMDLAGQEAEWRSVRDLDQELERSKPQHLERVSEPVS